MSQLSAMLGDIRLRQATGWSFRGLLEYLATLTRNQVRYTGTQVTIPMLTEPTSTQRQAFNLLGAAIPLTLKEPEHRPANPVKHQVRPEIACRTSRSFGLVSSRAARSRAGRRPRWL
ncbi:MAG TPA: hypothetical protein VJ418_27345 [Streptosporangiaceae bacterium]|nr:hypothetical protein [Streptosporangiaceae bacterium]